MGRLREQKHPSAHGLGRPIGGPLLLALLALGGCGWSDESKAARTLRALGGQVTWGEVGGRSTVVEVRLSRLPSVREGDLAALASLPNLQKLELHKIQMEDADLAHLQGLAHLQELEIGYNLVSDKGLAHLKGLTSVKVLSLHGDQVGDAGVAHLKGLTNLERLKLTSTKVTNVGLQNLGGLTKVTSLALSGCTDVSDDGLAALKGLSHPSFA
jgi:Leucine-rich repeat (LRR) protein